MFHLLLVARAPALADAFVGALWPVFIPAACVLAGVSIRLTAAIWARVRRQTACRYR